MYVRERNFSLYENVVFTEEVAVEELSSGNFRAGGGELLAWDY